jgi:hypothetical protein
MTYNDGPQMDLANPGRWKMPTRFEDRQQTTVDPQTGALLHQVTLDYEAGRQNGFNGLFLTYGGFNRVCDSKLVGPTGGPKGFVCTFPRYGQMGNTSYFIVPSTGEVRILGWLPILYSNPMGPLTADLFVYGDTGFGAIDRATYVGGFQPADDIPLDSWVTYSNYPPEQMMHDFDPTFDPTAYGCGRAWAGPGQYVLFECGSAGQDSPGWLGVLYGGDGRPIQQGCTAGADCPRVVAAMNVFTAQPTRYCGLHNVQQVGNIASINVQVVSGQPTCAAFGHIIYWRFLDDPHGTDTTNTTVVVDHYFDGGGHWDYGPLGRLTEAGAGWDAIFGPVADHLNQPMSLNIDDSPTFAGARGLSYGSTTSKHPSYHQVAGIAPQAELNWFMDAMSFDGGQFYSAPQGATYISGQLFKWNPSPEAPGLSRKQVPTLAVSGGYALRDISGPGSVLTDTAADSYKYCVALIAGECRAGSAPGDVFLNAPNVQYAGCAGSDGPNPQTLDLCVGNFPAYAQAITQMVMGSDSADSNSRSRVITHGLTGVRNSFYYWTAKSLPDASWALFTRGLVQPGFGDLLTVWMAKLPPQPAPDGVDRSTFLPLTLTLTPPANSQIASAVVQFGYAEQGRPDQYFCTSRRETCVAATATFTPDSPFVYANTESYSGVPCAASCRIAIPVLPMHVVYYSVLYLNAAGKVVATGIQGVSAELATAGLSTSVISSSSSAPAAPKSLAGSSTTTRVVLSWTTGGGTTTGFNVYRDGVMIGKANAPGYVDSGLKPATTYSYTVAAFDATGVLSPMSNTLTIATQQPLTVSLTPTTVTLTPGGTQTFKATVHGSTNQTVTWTLGSPVGTITAAGVYTAPSKIPATLHVVLIATSVADPTASAPAVITLQPAALSKPPGKTAAPAEQ